jgi:hypothetical protein
MLGVLPSTHKLTSPFDFRVSLSGCRHNNAVHNRSYEVGVEGTFISVACFCEIHAGLDKLPVSVSARGLQNE